ncbi:MAG: DegV family protein, partial [Bacilli bacterium]|nr:DegV family protein [Bacilli bacterium]
MSKIKILLDSTCDLDLDLLKRFDLDYIKMGVTMDDKEYSASLSWEEYTPKEFYDFMRSGKRCYTNQVKEAAFEERFNELLDKGFDILYIGCSSGLSGSIGLGRLVAERILATRKEGKIEIVDPLCSGMAQGLMGIHASELRDEGKSIEEIAAILTAERFNYHQWCTVGTLTYLKNAGRVKASSAFFGNIFGVKPIIVSDRNGYNTAIKKVRGRKAALDEIIESAVNNVVDPANHYLAI